jgi:hypothetical protein
MLKKLLAVIILFVAAILINAAVRPAHFLVSRETVIQASPETIFPWINHSKKADSWMPWKDSDPGVTMTYSGPEEGVGSKSSWDSKGQMGTGEALVVESVPNTRVKTQLTYSKPFVMSQMAEMSLAPGANGTTVKWSVEGENTFFFRVLGTFMDCDKMIGGEFEKGLAKLKTQLESSK